MLKNQKPDSIFSLSRFFHKTKKRLPCWVAGRFFPKNDNCYQLQSQNLFIDCIKTGKEPHWKAGSWLALYLKSENNNKYQVGDYQLLNSPLGSFQEMDFSYQKKGELQQDWCLFLESLKEFFYSKALAYADTPGLVSCPGTEPHLQAFSTTFYRESFSQKMYLPTSPEMHLKKLLCQDWTDFFEIKKCYRNGELSSTHQLEFTLLEWYRAFYSLEELMKECYELLSFLKTKKFFKVPLPPAKFYRVSELFEKHLQFPLRPESSREELCTLLKDLGDSTEGIENFEEVFFLIFLNHIEPKLPKDDPVFISHYPAPLRAFSQLNSEGWALRFELYWQGLELANAFYEVISAREQEQLFKDHLQKRSDGISQDEELLSLMNQAMPPVSGVALGLDRLFLAIYKKENLEDTRLFPFLLSEDLK